MRRFRVISGRQKKIILKEIKELALRAGRYMLSRLGKAESRKKGKKDLVTEVDLYVEEFYKNELSRRWKEFGFLAEEKNAKMPDAEFFWAIDPLDGTNNFAHGYPVFCTSVALMHGREVILGVVYDPTREELFYSDGEGAFLNRKRIRVSEISRLEDALVCTGFAYRFSPDSDNNVGHFIDFLQRAQGVRRDGSAALDLCYVACGRFDGFWEPNLKPWDTPAGALIVRCAGGKVSDFSGGDFDPFFPEVVASNGQLHPQIIKVLRGR